jgi:hypothetical protein
MRPNIVTRPTNHFAAINLFLNPLQTVCSSYQLANTSRLSFDVIELKRRNSTLATINARILSQVLKEVFLVPPNPERLLSGELVCTGITILTMACKLTTTAVTYYYCETGIRTPILSFKGWCPAIRRSRITHYINYIYDEPQKRGSKPQIRTNTDPPGKVVFAAVGGVLFFNRSSVSGFPGLGIIRWLPSTLLSPGFPREAILKLHLAALVRFKRATVTRLTARICGPVSQSTPKG